jgi:hypothetical protein
MKKNKPGRPKLKPSQKKGKLRVCNIDDATYKIIQQLGRGNFSEGVRRAAHLSKPSLSDDPIIFKEFIL